MSRIASGLIFLAWALLPSGCGTLPKPYHRDPLIKDDKRQRGNFASAHGGVIRPEPLPPPDPKGMPTDHRY